MMNLPFLPVCETTAVDALVVWLLGTRLVEVVASELAAAALLTVVVLAAFLALGFDLVALAFVAGGLGFEGIVAVPSAAGAAVHGCGTDGKVVAIGTGTVKGVEPYW